MIGHTELVYRVYMQIRLTYVSIFVYMLSGMRYHTNNMGCSLTHYGNLDTGNTENVVMLKSNQAANRTINFLNCGSLAFLPAFTNT